MLEVVLSCKTTLTVNATVVEAVNTSRSRRSPNPGAWTY